jgi:mannose-1-phosphate guanylyltransferase
MAAGLGTRMRPLTDSLPKPLLPLFGKPLITFAFDHLIAAGVERFVVNTHHLPHCFEELFASGRYCGYPVSMVYEPERLETGGGIKNAAALIGNEPCWVYSGDILTDIDLLPVAHAHAQNPQPVTLVLRHTGFVPSIGCRDGRITEIRRGGEDFYDFANISIWEPEGIERLPDGPGRFIPVLAGWVAAGERVGGVPADGDNWFNIGTPEAYLGIHESIAKGSWKPRAFPDGPPSVHPTAHIPASARLGGFVSIGAGCEVGEQTEIRDSILWPGAKTASRIRLDRCIVRAFAPESASHQTL